VADKRKKTTFAIAIPEITKTDLLKPFEADSAVTAIAAGPGESTTTKVVTRKRINVSIGIIKFSNIGFKYKVLDDVHPIRKTEQKVNKITPLVLLGTF
jgi:hypothetical protein